MNLVPGDDRILRTPSAAIVETDFHSAQLVALAQALTQTMRAHNGAGLAAPQVGVCRRICIVANGDDVMVLCNPEIVAHGDETALGIEGCLSLPGELYEVSRYSAVTVAARRIDGQRFFVRTTDFSACVLQHEIDHLDGILICDRGRRVAETTLDEGPAA